MKGFMKLVLVILIAAVAGFAAARYAPQTVAATKETAFERVLRTGVIRCGYYVFPPVTYRDINTGELSGFSIDMFNMIGEKAGLKIEWTEEVNFGNWVEGLQADRFDAVCTPNWPDTALGRVVLFTRPMFYAAISPLVRADNTRFQTLADMNKPDVTFVGQDNNMLSNLTREAFPNAQLKQVSAMVDGPTMMQDVVSGKADAMLLDRNGLIEYSKRNNVPLRQIEPDKPVKGQPFVVTVAQSESALQQFLDNAVADLLATGSMNRLLTKWEPEPGTYLRVTDPYKVQ